MPKCVSTPTRPSSTVGTLRRYSAQGRPTARYPQTAQGARLTRQVARETEIVLSLSCLACRTASTLAQEATTLPWYIGAIGLVTKVPNRVWYMPNTTNPPLNNAEHDALIALTEWVEGGSGRSAPARLTATAFDGWNATIGIISAEAYLCSSNGVALCRGQCEPEGKLDLCSRVDEGA